jgi:hypothetical protein
MARQDEQQRRNRLKALGIRTDIPHPARVYDYLLGGKDNFAVDREAAEMSLKISPEIRPSARANRQFLVRAVRFLRDNGIRQFLDVGTGLPTSPNTYEVAQAGHPDARVVYVDNDPLVLRRLPCVRSEPGSLLVAAGRGARNGSHAICRLRVQLWSLRMHASGQGHGRPRLDTRGYSWAEIGARLGITRQAAQQRWAASF